MIFFFKQSKIVVDCFTDLPSVYELYKPSKSIDFYPEDFAKMPSYFMAEDPHLKISQKMGTIKRCIAIQEYYKNGFMIPMWTDFICQPKGFTEGRSAFGMLGGAYKYNTHFREQWVDSKMFSEYLHLKLISPWSFREKSGVKFTWNQASWNLSDHTKHFNIVPAIVSFELNKGTHVNMFVDKTVEQFTLNGGTPLVHLCPLSEKELVLKHHLVSEHEIKKLGIPDDFSWLLPNRYTRYKKLISNNSKKCPFGFGK